MRILRLIGAAILLSSAAPVAAALAASADDFKSAFAKAEAASKQAVALKAGWTTTASELAAAQKTAAAGNFDQAVAQARQAEALARASMAQAKEQETAWTGAVIH